LDSRSGETITTPPEISLVIPAFNEGHRIEQTLREALAFMATDFPVSEIILVDDGSTDDTLPIARAIASENPMLRVIGNRHGGKAVAVRTGMVEAKGNLIGFSDADLATPLHHLHDLVAAVNRGCAIAIGSREGAGSKRIGEPIYRQILGRAFNWLVRIVALPGFADTQCGFKLFRRDALEQILPRILLYSDASETVTGPRVTAFDVELLVIARRQRLRTCPVPVTWRYGEQTKVDPVRDTWHNLTDVVRILVNNRRGRYR
jgi:glycosyltransferase involved in cell wall biosynthesis